MDTARAIGRSIGDWYRPGTPKGIAGLQMFLNGMMLTALILLQARPWAALGALAALLALTLWLHGPRLRVLIALFGAIGWGAEAWLVGVGGVWAFVQPSGGPAAGDLFGVPFYMLPAWSLVGALMLALAGLFDENRPSPPRLSP